MDPCGAKYVGASYLCEKRVAYQCKWRRLMFYLRIGFCISMLFAALRHVLPVANWLFDSRRSWQISTSASTQMAD